MLRVTYQNLVASSSLENDGIALRTSTHGFRLVIIIHRIGCNKGETHKTAAVILAGTKTAAYLCSVLAFWWTWGSIREIGLGP